MKAATKAVKRARKTGRPRISHAERHACGKIKKAWSQDNKANTERELEKDAMSVAVEARQRIHGVEDGKSQLAGYTLGRIFLDGKITEEQRKAGDEFAEAMARYYRLTGVPFPSPRAQAIGGIRGSDGDVSESLANAARRASNTMMRLTGVLLQCKDGPQVRQTVISVCVMDYENMRDMPDMQMGWLKRGLTELAIHMGLRGIRE